MHAHDDPRMAAKAALSAMEELIRQRRQDEALAEGRLLLSRLLLAAIGVMFAIFLCLVM